MSQRVEQLIADLHELDGEEAALLERALLEVHLERLQIGVDELLVLVVEPLYERDTDAARQVHVDLQRLCRRRRRRSSRRVVVVDVVVVAPFILFVIVTDVVIFRIETQRLLPVDRQIGLFFDVRDAQHSRRSVHCRFDEQVAGARLELLLVNCSNGR